MEVSEGKINVLRDDSCVLNFLMFEVTGTLHYGPRETTDHLT